MTLSLRRRLQALMLIALLPLVLFACLSTMLLARQQREVLEQATMLRARAIMAAVDTRLDAAVDWLQVLATAQSVRDGDFGTFHDTGRRAARGQPQWVKLLLLDASGHPILDTSMPYGEHARQTADSRSIQRVVETQRPMIGDLSMGLRGVRAFPVRVPVIFDGSLKYILTAVVTPEFILQMVTEQEVAGDHAVAVLDAAGTVVARSRGNEQYGGQTATEAFRQAVAQGTEGWSEQSALDGERVYVGFSRSPATGWTAAVALPHSAVARVAEGAYLLLAGGMALSLVASFGAAVLMMRWIQAEAPTAVQPRAREAAAGEERAR